MSAAPMSLSVRGSPKVGRTKTRLYSGRGYSHVEVASPLFQNFSANVVVVATEGGIEWLGLC